MPNSLQNSQFTLTNSYSGKVLAAPGPCHCLALLVLQILATLLCATVLESRQHFLPCANRDAVEVNSLRQDHRARAWWKHMCPAIIFHSGAPTPRIQPGALPKHLQGMPDQILPKVQILYVKSLSHLQLFATPWTVAYQAPQSMDFSRQEYWSGLLLPSLGHLPDPGLNLGLLHCRQMLYHLSHQGSDLISLLLLYLPCTTHCENKLEALKCLI